MGSVDEICGVLNTTEFEKNLSLFEHSSLNIILACLQLFPKKLQLQLIKYTKLRHEKSKRYDIPDVKVTQNCTDQTNSWTIEIPKQITKKRTRSGESIASKSSSL